jgi:hypothetical protein
MSRSTGVVVLTGRTGAAGMKMFMLMNVAMGAVMAMIMGMALTRAVVISMVMVVMVTGVAFISSNVALTPLPHPQCSLIRPAMHLANLSYKIAVRLMQRSRDSRRVAENRPQCASVDRRSASRAAH